MGTGDVLTQFINSILPCKFTCYIFLCPPCSAEGDVESNPINNVVCKQSGPDSVEKIHDHGKISHYLNRQFWHSGFTEVEAEAILCAKHIESDIAVWCQM